MSAVKHTPAMREWCRRLANPKSCTLYSTGRGFFGTNGFSSIAPPTTPMVGRLEDAGLITWSSPSARDEYREAVLTEAGKAVAAAENAKATGSAG